MTVKSEPTKYTVKIPGEFSYSLAPTPYGEALFVSTEKGLCQLSFLSEYESPEEIIQNRFPGAVLRQEVTESHRLATELLHCSTEEFPGMKFPKLYLKGTEFQRSVWNLLLTLERDRLYTYSEIAGLLGRPRAVRAVASAVGANPIAWLIPCHLVVRLDGSIGGYRWGVEKKRAMTGSLSAGLYG
ncbi:MAG: methylated-DNA--[protein]-cysteine S-methyltransferase [Balneolaceae bacterium]|nr:MAG: methylated-DNA--[protein]-cysteine S-methyltransferase [Balneolaceae bacterium]